MKSPLGIIESSAKAHVVTSVAAAATPMVDISSEYASTTAGTYTNPKSIIGPMRAGGRAFVRLCVCVRSRARR